ncbi:MAG: type II toxin-antitoxin system Phd/YefM family antitoxin [Acidobacteria bacterium]|nr:type II toxin-antitoxin system Phd/YefM family antitoxin [Acidobacteriota bacterium]
MRALRVSEDIVPVSQFKTEAAEWLKRCAATGQAVVITQNGKPAGVLISPRVFDELTELKRFVATIQEGLQDAEAGRLTDHASVVSQVRQRYRQHRSR